jgi:selenocysteine lyase/cysteine desulfurase
MQPIYLDYNASTPIDPAVADAMRPLLEGTFGNPSSGHWAGAPAKAALEQARGQVAALLGAAPDEIVFTSGGSEANNLAIKGTFFALNRQDAHVITSAIEHPAVLAPCRFLERLGGSVTYLPVDGTGLIDPESLTQKGQSLARRRVSSLRWATRSQATSVVGKPSKSLARRRHRPNQAKVRSTTHRLGSSWKPLTPSGRLTISIVHGPQWESARGSCGPR